MGNSSSSENSSNTSSIASCTETLKEWVLNYELSIETDEKIYNKYYIPTFYQEILWFIFMTLFGIIGQVLFRIYYAYKGIIYQWWWYLILLTNLPLISIIPAFSLCVNMFWLGYFEEKYISIDYKNSNNIIHFFYLIILKFILGLIIIVCKPTLIPFIYFQLEDSRKQEILEIIIFILFLIIVTGIIIYQTIVN